MLTERAAAPALQASSAGASGKSVPACGARCLGFIGSSVEAPQGVSRIAALEPVSHAGTMVRLMPLAGAWVLMRRYIFRRRTRIQRQTLVSRMTEKLRALARVKVRRPAVMVQTRPALPVPPRLQESRDPAGEIAESGSPVQPGLPRVSKSRLSPSAFRSSCRERSVCFFPGPGRLS
jgi:hypothetical protein